MTSLYFTTMGSDLYFDQGVTDALDLSRGNGVAGVNTNTVAGPTSGVQVFSMFAYQWISAPLNGVSIGANLVTLNLWGSESSMSANTGFDVLIERCNTQGTVLSQILRSERGVELGTTNAVQNWTATATATNLGDGDRIKVTVFGNDAGGTMAAGYMFAFRWGSPTAGQDGDAYVAFTETLTLYVPPPKMLPVTRLPVRVASTY